METTFVRVLRTTTSERHLLRRGSADFAALDLHYLPGGTVQATLIIFDGSGVGEKEVPALLATIDEVLLPEARLDDHSLTFTVVLGRVLGAFQSQPDPASE